MELVVWGHFCELYTKELFVLKVIYIVYIFHIPAFIILSGYF